MHAPWRAHRYFARGGDGASAGRGVGFLLHHTGRWLIYWFAAISCGYGERPWRAALLSAAIVLAFAWLYAWSGGIQATGESSRLGYYLYSLGAFTTLGTPSYRAVNWQADLLTVMEAGLGVALFALLMFSLGNRISRL